MIGYTSELTIERQMEDVLILLPHYYYSKEASGRAGTASGFNYQTRNFFVTVDTRLAITPAGNTTVISMNTSVEGRFFLVRLILPFFKTLLASRQYRDLYYLKLKLEE